MHKGIPTHSFICIPALNPYILLSSYNDYFHNFVLDTSIPVNLNSCIMAYIHTLMLAYLHALIIAYLYGGMLT